jgi:prolyl oligopeptidase
MRHQNLGLTVLALSLAGLPAAAQKLGYPDTRRMDHVDTYFGDKVADPYRWLEDENSPETARWVEAQNKVTFAYLDKIPYRQQIKARLEKLYNYVRYGAPFRNGG